MQQLLALPAVSSPGASRATTMNEKRGGGDFGGWGCRFEAEEAYRMLQELFSRNGFTFWLENPTSRQSSASCSVTYFTMSATACDTVMRWIAASRRSCSVIALCCCRFEAIISITAVSDNPIVNVLPWGTLRSHRK
uniref:Putative secreted protein n=1 Tax=Anopheles darlingi TaxID=43151 RepID=A0A2M4D200_ANODA